MSDLMCVTKRNGKTVPYEEGKVVRALTNAMNSTGEYNETALNVILGELRLHNYITVEEIQDQLENGLMRLCMYKTAKAFILYRKEHAEDREIQNRINYIDSYIEADNAATGSETDPNANVSIKNVANLESEIWKEKNRKIQRRFVKTKLKEMYPEVADQYAQDLDSHILYAHDESVSVPKKYCEAVTLYPLMLEGTGKVDGVTPSPPNDLQSFSGQVTNLVFLLSSQARGAVATGDVLVAYVFYIRKEFGNKWYEHLDEVVTTDVCMQQRTVKDIIRKALKQFIYGVNQPAGNRSYNSPFTNVSYYDSVYFESLFGDFYYPDGTKPEWKEVDIVQRMFMELHRELRLIKPLTFPVSTIAMVHDGKDIIDKEYKELCAEEWAKGGSFFAYINDSPTSLSSCCFSKDTKFLWKGSISGVNLTTFEEFYNMPYANNKENVRFFHNGSWVKGKVVKLPNRPMYKVITSNNKEFTVTDNHIHVTLDGEKSTDNLTVNDYLLFNTLPTMAISEVNEHLTYEQGFAVGSFIGDGSFGGVNPNTNTIYDTIFSQNVDKYERCISMVNEANKQLGRDTVCRLAPVHNNVYNIHISSKELVAFIQRWTSWSPGTRAFNKKLNLDCLRQSYEFRKGILDGWYSTDGGNNNRCYTTSPELAEDMEILIMSLGMQSIVNVTDRTDEEIIIRDTKYTRNYPLYCVRWYEPAAHRSNKNTAKTWIKKNNSIYFKVKSIEKVDYEGDTYCVECTNPIEPYFTLPCGLITHNCRVMNEITDNTFSSTIGLTGIMTGSCNVITLNLNRIVQNYFKEHPELEVSMENYYRGFEPYMIEILERVYKYQIAFKTGLYDMEDKGMFTDSNGGYIFISKLYSTIGMLGYCEAAEFLGLTVSNNEEYKKFLAHIFSIVKTQNKLHSIRDTKRPFVFNTEAVPGESLAVKFYQWDKADGYTVPEDQNLYSSYFFKQWDDKISILDKLKLHGKYINSSTDGGQACHIHLQEHLSKEQYLKIIELCVKEGVNYFTFNIPMSECKSCGHTVNAPITECPICGSHDIDWWIRIIGYLTRVSSWDKERQIEAAKRVYSSAKDLH